MQNFVGSFPVFFVDQILPFRNFTSDRASPVTERNTAIHTSCSLIDSVFVVERLLNFSVIIYSVVQWTITSIFPSYCHETFWISHGIYLFYFFDAISN